MMKRIQRTEMYIWNEENNYKTTELWEKLVRLSNIWNLFNISHWHTKAKDLKIVLI